MVVWSPPPQDENAKDHRLPGGSLFDAIHNRQLMTWSDRGGASRHLGDRWAARCIAALSEGVGGPWPGGNGGRRLSQVIRLDDNRQIERQANRHQLENPDFLLIGQVNGHDAIIQAADAKFAVDRIKPSQVSAEVVRQLIDVPETSAVQAMLTDALGSPEARRGEIIDGIFIAPASIMTDLLFARAKRSGRVTDAGDIILTIPPEPDTLFTGLPAAGSISTLARIDRLRVSPRSNLLAAVYYFRVACACFYFWDEEHRPLLSARRTHDAPETALVAGDIATRARNVDSAIDILYHWHRDLSWITAARREVNQAARMPVSMRDIRRRVEAAESPNSKRVVRMVRRELELRFRDRLVDVVGEIYPDDPRPLDAIIRQVRRASKDLRSGLYRDLDEVVARLVAAEQESNA